MVRFILSLACLLFLAPWGCGSKACNKDTDCKMPQVCLAGSCVNTYALDSSTDGGEFDIPPDGFPDTDADWTPPDGEDTPTDTPEEEGPVACVPQLSPPYSIMGSSIDSGMNERPEAITLADNSFYILGRKIVTGDPPYKLTAIKITTNGTRGSDPVDLIGTTSLPDHHPFIPQQSGMIALFKDLAGIAENKFIFVGYVPGDIPSAPLQLSPSNAESTEAYAVDNGTNLYLVWRQEDVINGGSTISGCFVDYSVEASDVTTLAGDGTADLGQPVTAYSGSGYLVAYFYHADASGTDVDSLMLIELDDSGALVGEEAVDLDDERNSVVGRPAMVWAGDRWAVFWQEADGGVDVPSVLYLTTKTPGAGALDLNVTSRWQDIITSFAHVQTGELDMVWTGSSLGLILKYDGQTAGKKIYFLELESNGDKIGDTLLVNPGASSSFNPALTFMQTSRDRYYLFVWLQYSTGIYQIFTASYGCTED